MKTTLYRKVNNAVLTAVLFLFANATYSQTWNYDFGIGTGTWNTATGYNTILLPQPVSGAGAAQLSIGAVAQGSGFYLDNPGLTTLGSGSELRATASTGAASNKFSVYGYNASKVFHTSFSSLFGNSSGQAGPKSGEWYFYQGSGSLFSNMSNASNNTNQSFVSLRFTFIPGNQVAVAYHNGSGWIDLSSQLPFRIDQARVYQFEFFGNNTTETAQYFKGTTHTLATDQWDLWINGLKVASGLTSGGMANNTDIDSWLFSGEISTTNFATMFLDDLTYSNYLPGSTLPVELTGFSGFSTEEGIVLEWQTATEINNSHFVLEHSKDAFSFLAIENVAGAGNSATFKSYRFLDRNASAGLNYYRLKQTDFDGRYSYSSVIAVANNGMKAEKEIRLGGINDGNLTVFFKGNPGTYQCEIISLNGQILFGDIHISIEESETFSIPVGNLQKGIFIFRMTDGQDLMA